MKVSLGADYKAYKLKEKLAKFFIEEGINFSDSGCWDEEVNDFMDFAKEPIKDVLSKQSDFAILMCYSGFGMDITANRYSGIRAIRATTPKDAILGRKYDNANVLCLASGITKIEDAKLIIKKFLSTKYEKLARRERRIKKLNSIACK